MVRFLSLEDPSLMVVTWVTMNAINVSAVEYGENGILDQRATGWARIFQDSGSENRKEYIHRVVLRDLKPGQRYCMIQKLALIGLYFVILKFSLSLR